MSQRFYGQLNMTTLIQTLKSGYSAFKSVQLRDGSTAVFVDVNLWVNDTPDKFGNHCSMQLSGKQDKEAAEGKTYIGNLKLAKPKETPVTQVQRQAMNDIDQFMNAVPPAASGEGDPPF